MLHSLLSSVRNGVDKDAFKLYVTLLIGSGSKSKLRDHTNVAKK